MQTKEIFDFLRELQSNNNRTWFQENKAKYQVARKQFEALVDDMIVGIAKFDPEAAATTTKDSIFRIYRDTRFAADKTPYKTHFGAFITQGGKLNQRGGYYIHLEPGGSLFAGGVWHLDPPLLKALRQDIYDNMEEFVSIVEDPAFTRHYKMDDTYKLKRMPAPFPADAEGGEWLKHKNYTCSSFVEDDFFDADDALTESLKRLELIYPLNRFINYTIDETMHG